MYEYIERVSSTHRGGVPRAEILKLSKSGGEYPVLGKRILKYCIYLPMRKILIEFFIPKIFTHKNYFLNPRTVDKSNTLMYPLRSLSSK